MNSKIFMVLRILLGIFVLVFGANKFYEFLPPLEGLSNEALAHFLSLKSSNILLLSGVVEVVAGLALITNKFGALMALILMSVSVNAVLFHAVLDPGNIAPAVALLALNLIALYNYKDNYKALLS